MKALLARANGPSAAFALFTVSLLLALPVIYGPIVGVVFIAAVFGLGLLIFAPEVGAFVSRIAGAAYHSRVRFAVGAAIFALGVLALLFVGGAAHAADAAAPAAPDITVTLDYWWSVAGKVVLIASGLSTVIPPEIGSKLGVVFKVLNWAALNIWHAKNAPSA